MRLANLCLRSRKAGLASLLVAGVLGFSCADDDDDGSGGTKPSDEADPPESCVKDIADADITETTQMSQLALAALRSGLAVGDLLGELVKEMEKVPARVTGGSDEPSVSDSHWQFADGVHTYKTSGDRQIELGIRFYWGSGIAGTNEGDLITANVFDMASYVTNPRAEKPSLTNPTAKVKVSWDSLGPLSPLVGIPTDASSPKEFDVLKFLDTVSSNFKKVTWDVTYVVTNTRDEQTLSINLRSERKAVSDISALTNLKFSFESGTGSWTTRGQTLTVDGYAIDMIFGGLGVNSGNIDFTVTGDERFTYKGKGELSSGSTKLTLTCENDVVIRQFPEPTPSRLFFVDQRAQQDCEAIAEPTQSQVVTCDSAADLPRCIVDAADQRNTGATSLDLAVVMDVSGSMWDDIRAVKKNVNSIAEQIKAKIADSRFGLVDFSDAVDPHISSVLADFTADVGSFQGSVNNLELLGGGDYPEASLEGTKTALDELTWRDDAGLKVVVVITDAATHNPGPTGVTLDEVIAILAERNIFVIPILLGF